MGPHLSGLLQEWIYKTGSDHQPPGIIISAPTPVSSTLKTVCFVVMVMLENTVHSKSPAGPRLTT